MNLHLTAYRASRLLDALAVAIKANPDDERNVVWEELYNSVHRLLDGEQERRELLIIEEV
jgi:hypothetical protein